MLLLFEFVFPVKDPVVVFTIVLLVLFLAPIVLQRLRIPGLIGIILAGTALGPTGFHILERSYAIELFGTVGLLYIMFQAGLEIDLNDFKKNRNKSLTFGLLSFIIPQGLGTLGGLYLLDLSMSSALLLASMFASHTLIAFPIISRLDLMKNQAVTITLGGTLIVNILALLVLAAIAGGARGEADTAFWIRLLLSSAVFVFMVMWVGPRVIRWFFRNVESEGVSQYTFVLFFVFAASFGAKLAGIEAIIGAFLAGLALNRLIPPTSPLMNRIGFVGNTLFIPFFLINVGMLADLSILVRGKEELLIVGAVVGMVIFLKWLPAKITTWIYKYRKEEGSIIFGLSVAQAASTLAAALVGYELGLVNDNVLNGIIMMILVTCLLSSVVVERAGKKLAVVEKHKTPDAGELPDRILAPISNPESMNPLIELAIMIKKQQSAEPIYPLSVIPDDEMAGNRILTLQRDLEKAKKLASASDIVLQPITRVDLHPGGGIVRAAKELMANKIVIGWHGKYNPKDYLFGTVLDYLLEHTPQMILVTNLKYPLSTTRRLVIVVPENAELEPGFPEWLNTLRALAAQAKGLARFKGAPGALAKIKEALAKGKPTIESTFESLDNWDDLQTVCDKIDSDDLYIFISAREATISHQPYMTRVPRYLSRHFQDVNFIVLYPEQVIG
ncbi:MAG: cation:proton antiporter [Saprospiraceae bacterium]|nr:cation:proton antiporter [Saprospiraceae bacterium]